MKFFDAVVKIMFLAIVVVVVIKIPGGVPNEFIKSALGRPRAPALR